MTDYIHKFHTEAIFHVKGSKDDYDYAYVTYDRNKLKGFQLKNIRKYNIQAWATIPVTENGFVDMRLFTGKDDKILEFTMQYRDFVKYKNILGKLNIRSDYGHGTEDPHIDIELLDQNGKKALNENGYKILDEKVPQSSNFLNYEAAINAVFMQVEKYNPLIGAKYWLSPAGIHEERVYIVSELRSQLRISTSLTILARAINVKLYEEAIKIKEIDTDYFREIAEVQLRSCKEKEQEYGGTLDISEVKYSNQMSVLPFLFFIPDENAYYEFKRSVSDGTEILIEPVAIVSERKEGNEITRGITDEEKRGLNYDSKENAT